MSAMAILEIEPVKESTFPRLKFARYVRERVERYGRVVPNWWTR